MTPTSIEPFIHHKVVVLHQENSAHQAARAMCDRKIGCVVVADQSGHITGILTDRDLACGLLAYGLNSKTPVSELMSEEPACVDENATLDQVVALMEERGIRRIPVVQHLEGSKQKCVGIISLDDLIASQAIDYQQLARIVQSQIFRHRRYQSPGMQRLRAESRSEAHMEQTLNRFYKTISEKTKVSEELIDRVTLYILSAIVKRLHYTGAAHFVSQLPHLLQEDLLSLPAGPDRSITLDSILNEMEAKFEFNEQAAQSILIRFFDALGGLIDSKEFEHVKVQLPPELQSAFIERDEKSA